MQMGSASLAAGLVISLTAIAPARASAQERLVTIPTDLVVALLGYPSFGSEGAARFALGSAPDAWSAFIPPAPAVLIGTAVHGRGGTLILEYPTPSGDAVESYADFLQRAGWTRIQRRETGKAESDAIFGQIVNLCRDRLHASAFPVPGASSGSRVSVQFRPVLSGACVATSDEDPRARPNLPRLQPPPGAARTGSRGSVQASFAFSDDVVDRDPGQNTGHTERFASIAAPAEVLAHYREQLERAGWTVGAPLRETGDDVLVAPVEARDSAGKSWRGALTILALGNERDVALRLARSPSDGSPRALPPAPTLRGRSPRTLPESFVLGLLGLHTVASREPVDIAVDRAPDGFSAAMIPAPSARVVGGFTRHRGGTLVLAFPSPAAEAVASYASFLRRAGWTTFGASPRGGFRVAADADGGESVSLCRDSARVYIAPTPGATTGSYLGVTLDVAEGSHRVCRPVPEEDSPGGMAFPVLGAPSGAEQRGSGSQSAGGDVSIDTYLVTTLSPRQLVDHYAAQLRAAGWQVGAVSADGTLAVRPVEMRDGGGGAWRGALTAVDLAGARDVSLRMARASGRP